MKVHEQALDDELRRFLTETPSGSPDGIRIRDVAPNLEGVPEATWLTARVQGALVGASALVPRPWGVWRCHLTVSDAHHEAAIDALVDAAHARTADTLCAGSCEDSHTHLMRALRRVGYQEQATMEVAIYARPAPDRAVGPPRHPEALRQALAARDVHHDLMVGPEAFSVIHRGDEVVAGVALVSGAWNIDHLGPGSAVTLPLVRRLGVPVQPLRFGALVAGFGPPRELERCWRAALHSASVPVGMVGADVRDRRWAEWSRLRRGAVGRAIGTSTQRVLASGELPRPLAWTSDFLR